MIEIRDVSKWYGEFQVLRDCSTRVAEGEVVVVCGPSGSGKSTLIKCVNGLEHFQKGDITVAGTSLSDPRTDLPRLRARVGMVFQHFELFPHLSIMRNLTLAQTKVLRRTREEAEARGMQLLERVGLKDQAAKYPAQLSGGQQQRVAIARALVNDPVLFLADEPTGNLDTRTSVDIMAILQALNRTGITIVLVTHEEDIARYARRILRFRDGELTDDECVNAPLAAADVLADRARVSRAAA